MSWKTVNGTTIEYPFAIAAAAVRLGRDDVNEIVAATRRIHDQARRLDMQVRDLQAENLRLRHENEFMLRLLNERDD